MKIKIFVFLFILGFLFASTGSAQAYTINGRLADWGVNPKTGDWVPKSGIYYTAEDTTSGDFVDPGWGGQKFDAEALYIDWDDTKLYIALVTGFPNTGGTQNNGTWYSAGDIAIDFGNNGIYEYGIEIGSHSPEYTSWGGFDGTPGDVYKNITWKETTGYTESNPLCIADTLAPTYAGEAKKFVYNDTYYSDYTNADDFDDHWVVEMSIKRSVFGSDWDNIMSVHWTQTCGNDNINVATPEPLSMSLFGTGLFGVAFGLRRRKI